MTQLSTDQIFKSRKYLLEILEEQGYNISDYKDFSIHEIHAMYQSKQLDLLIERNISYKKKGIYQISFSQNTTIKQYQRIY